MCHIVSLKPLTHKVEMVIFTNCTYLGTQNRRYTYHMAPFRSSNTTCEQQGFHHRGSTRSNNWFYSTSLCEYYNSVFHSSNITARNQETSPHVRSTIYEGNLPSSVMIEETIIQTAISSIETFSGTKSEFEALPGIHRKKHNMYSFLQIDRFFTFNRQYIKSVITKPKVDRTNMGIVHAIFSNSI